MAGAVAVADLGAISDTLAPVARTVVREARNAGVKLWQLISVGYDRVDLDAFRSVGLPIANIPGQFSAC